MRLVSLVIEPDREDHVARHGVTQLEAREVVFGDPHIRRTRQRRLLVVGQTAAGRYLTVVVAHRTSGVYGLVTARDATLQERRAYLEHRRG